MINKEMIFIGGFVVALFLLKKKEEEGDDFVQAAGRISTRKRPVKSDFRSASQVRALQKRFPYSAKNKKKPWWKCGCSGGGIGGCVKGACIGPGIITINF